MGLPNPGMTIEADRTALVITDLQNDFLTRGGNGWLLLADSYTKLDCCTGPRGQALIVRSAAFAADHKLDAAARDANDAIKFAQQAQGQLPTSSVTGQAWLALARVEQAQGHPEEARRAYALAARNLHETLGDEHPDTVRARKGMSDT